MIPATYPDGATVIGFPFASWLRRYGKYSAPFWLFGIVRLATASVMMSPISGSEVLPELSATASAGGSMIMKARLRSQNASASATTGRSQIPGVSRRLKICTLSSEPSCANARAKSAGE